MNVDERAAELSSSIDNPAVYWGDLETQIEDFIEELKTNELTLTVNRDLQSKLLKYQYQRNGRIRNEINVMINNLMYSLTEQYGKIKGRSNGGRKSRRAKQRRKKQTKRRKYRK